MSAPIGPGDYVVCVDFRPDLGRPVPFVADVPYRIREVDPADPKAPDPNGFGVVDGFLFWNAPDPQPAYAGDTPWWGSPRFRPIYRPKQELISRLLSDVPAKVPA